MVSQSCDLVYQVIYQGNQSINWLCAAHEPAKLDRNQPHHSAINQALELMQYQTYRMISES